MKSNIGKSDKILRLLAAVLSIILYLGGIIDGVMGIVVLLVGLILGATALVNFCPIYWFFGLDSRKKENT